MNKQDIAREIGILEGKVSEIDSEIRHLNDNKQKFDRDKNLGGIALLIGIIGILFFYNLWFLWGFLILIGALAYFTNSSKTKSSQSELNRKEKEQKSLKEKLAEQRALLYAE